MFFLSPYMFACVYPGPFDSKLSTELALNKIAEYRSVLEALKEEESSLYLGLGLSKTQQFPSESIRTMEKVWRSTGLVGHKLQDKADHYCFEYLILRYLEINSSCCKFYTCHSDAKHVICLFMCLFHTFCTGHRAPAAGLGDHTRVECKLGHLEGCSTFYAADGEYGQHGAGLVKKTPKTSERTKGQFHWRCY